MYANVNSCLIKPSNKAFNGNKMEKKYKGKVKWKRNAYYLFIYLFIFVFICANTEKVSCV